MIKYETSKVHTKVREIKNRNRKHRLRIFRDNNKEDIMRTEKNSEDGKNI